MASSVLLYLRMPFIASSAVALLASGVLYFKQKYLASTSPYEVHVLKHLSELIYPRNLPLGARTEEGVPKPTQFGLFDWNDVRIQTPDYESLHAYYIRPSNKRNRSNLAILMFHGNAGNIGHRVPIARMLEETNGCNVLMLEYRGYGLSTGTPNEHGLKIDAQAALDWLRTNEETKDTKILLYGQSLGGAVAIQLAAKNHHSGDIVGIVLENTFLSIRKMIPKYAILTFCRSLLISDSVFPPAKLLSRFCHQYWLSEETLPTITNIPILFLSGLKDEIVP